MAMGAADFPPCAQGGEFMEFVCEDSNNESIDPVTGAEITTIPERRSLNQADNNNQGDTK